MDETKRHIPRSFRLIIRRVIVGILLTGIIASASTLGPLYYYLQKSTDQLAMTYARAQAIAVNNQLDHYSAIATQFSSRSHIRSLLEDYHANRIGLEQLQLESAPRLRDAAQLIPELVVGYRLDSQSNLIARYSGPTMALELPMAMPLRDILRKQLHYVAVTDSQDNTNVLISVTSPILSPVDQTMLGIDVLLFSSTAVLEVLQKLNQFGGQSAFQLVNARERVYLHFKLQNQQLEHREFADDSTFNLAGYGGKAFVFHEVTGSGERRDHFFVPFEDSDWGLVVIAENQPLISSVEAVFAWVIAAILLTAVLGAYLIRQWLQPVIQSQLHKNAQLKESNSKLKLANTVFEKTHEAIVITDPKLTIVRANHAFAMLFDMDVMALKQKSLLNFIDQEKITESMQRAVTQHLRERHNWQGEVWYIKPSGVKFPALQTITTVRNKGGIATQLIHIFNDISLEKTAQKRIENLALTDSLTHLPNRFALLKLLEENIRARHADGSVFAVLFIDLDKFKPVNDTHGHAVGDALLQAIGPRMKEALRANDVIGRLGCDEFVVIIDIVQQREDVEAIAQKILDSLERPFRVGDLSLQIGASVGIAFYPEHGSDAEALLNAADNAMYAAKQAGRQC